jgi:hypothetical protein
MVLDLGPLWIMRRRRRRAQALVEFALVAPFFIVALLSLIEFGRAIYTIQILNNAAREGARYAIVHGASSACPSGPMPFGYGVNPCDPAGNRIVDTVRSNAIAVLQASPADIAVTVKWCRHDTPIDSCPAAPGDGSNDRGETVAVSVSYGFRSLVPLVPLPTFTLTGGSTLVINH